MARNTIPELDYLTQVCFELYESETKTEPGANPDDPNVSSYSIRISISPGCHSNDPLYMSLDSKHCIGCASRKGLTGHLDWKYVVETLRDKFHRVKLPSKFIPINLGEASLQRGGPGAGPPGINGDRGAMTDAIIEEALEIEMRDEEEEDKDEYEEGLEEESELGEEPESGSESVEEGGVEIGGRTV